MLLIMLSVMQLDLLSVMKLIMLSVLLLVNKEWGMPAMLLVQWNLSSRKVGHVSAVSVLQYSVQLVRIRGMMSVASCCFALLVADCKVISSTVFDILLHKTIDMVDAV
jgi:hypothetical protein